MTERAPYTIRRLPPEEWGKLADTMFQLTGLPDPAHAVVLVAETSDGQIVGRWGVFTAIHLDGLAIDPEYQKSLLAGRLLQEMRALLTELGIPVAFTIIQDEHVRGLAEQAGFARIGDLYATASLAATEGG